MFHPFYRLPLFLILLILSVQLQSQSTISGRVLDEEERVLEFVNISAIDISSQKLVNGCITDDKGKFQLELSSTANIKVVIEFIGYEDYEIELKAGQSKELADIILKSQISSLDEIVITAEKPVFERKEDRLVFNIASSPLKSGYDGIEILKRSPTIWVDSDDNILLRNGIPVIMINGRRLNLSGEELASYLKNLSSDNIKSVEIQSSAGSNEDADNLGGVINIILKRRPIGFNSNLRSAYTILGDGLYQWESRINLNYGAQKWNLYGNYNLTKRDILDKITTDISYHDSDEYLQTKLSSSFIGDHHDYQIGLVLEPWSKHEFGLEYFGQSRSIVLNNSGPISLSLEEEIIDKGFTSAINDFDIQLNSYVGNYSWNLDSLGSNLKLIADHTKQENRDDNIAFSNYEKGNLIDTEDRGALSNFTSLISLRADLNLKLKNQYNLEMGLKSTRTERSNVLFAESLFDNIWEANSRTSSIDYKEYIGATYFNFSKQISAKHFAKLGLRIEQTKINRLDLLLDDQIDKSYLDWFPSIFYSFELDDNSSIAAKFNKRISRPSFRDLNNIERKLNDFRYARGNPDLLPEYINQYELSYQKKKQTITAYLNITKDAVNGVYTLEDSIAIYQRQNNGIQTQYGLEYSINQDLNDWWNLRLGANVYHRKFTTVEGIDMFEKSTADFNFGSNFQINKTTAIDLSARFLSPRADAYYEQEAFYWVEFFIKKSFLDKKLNCRVYFNDIFNVADYANERAFPDITTSLYRKNRTRNIRLWVSYNLANQNKTSDKQNKVDREARRRI